MLGCGLCADPGDLRAEALRACCTHDAWRSLPAAMPSYTVTVATGSQWFAGTDDYIYLSLVGSAGCSEKHLLDKPFYNDFERGAVRAIGRTGLGVSGTPSGRGSGGGAGPIRGSREPRGARPGSGDGVRPATTLGNLDLVEARPGPCRGG